MSATVIVGATRGLGAALAKEYAEGSHPGPVYGTTRSQEAPSDFPSTITWLKGIDLMNPSVGDTLAKQLGSTSIGTLIITAGYFATEDLTAENGPNWDHEVRMYTTSSIAPVFIVHRLLHANLLPTGSKIVLVSSESGSIALRHEKEGGGNYAHHASKAALNMVGKLLFLDLKDKGIVISLVHPGFMRTEMTKGVGFDKYWDDGGAVTPEESAKSLIEWTDGLDMSKSGQYWAPRGPRDIGTAESVLGSHLPTPLQLPW